MRSRKMRKWILIMTVSIWATGNETKAPSITTSIANELTARPMHRGCSVRGRSRRRRRRGSMMSTGSDGGRGRDRVLRRWGSGCRRGSGAHDGRSWRGTAKGLEMVDAALTLTAKDSAYVGVLGVMCAWFGPGCVPGGARLRGGVGCKAR